VVREGTWEDLEQEGRAGSEYTTETLGARWRCRMRRWRNVVMMLFLVVDLGLFLLRRRMLGRISENCAPFPSQLEALYDSLRYDPWIGIDSSLLVFCS